MLIWALAFVLAWSLLWLVLHQLGRALEWFGWPIWGKRALYTAFVTLLAAPYLPGIPLPMPSAFRLIDASTSGLFGIRVLALNLMQSGWAILSYSITAAVCWWVACTKFRPPERTDLDARKLEG